MDEWDEQDAATLRKFLTEHPKFMRELESRMPEIKTTNLQETAMTGARHQGAKDIVKALRDMSAMQSSGAGAPFINASQD